MAKILEKRWGLFGWGVIASVLLHVVIASFFLVKLPEKTPEPQEETVSVEMVPPPEEQKPEEKKPEEQAALKVPEEPKPEEKKPEEPAAAQKPADEQKPEEQKAEAKPQEAPKEEPKPDEPPPPPPAPPEVKPPEPPKPPEEKPPEEKPEDKKAEEPPKADPAEQAKADEQPGGDEGKPQPIQPMRPVFEFGDKDTGPKKTDDGDASTASGTPAATPDTQEPKPEDTASAGKPDGGDKPAAKPVPDDINLPEVAIADSHQENNGPPAEALGVTTTDVVQEKPSEVAKTDPAPTAEPGADPLTKAKKIYSQNDTGDTVGRTAIDGMPRGIRVAELCTTELREQLKRSPQGFRPELLPSYRLQQGTVLEVKRGAFRASARWYDMSFRCEVDSGATKVVSFAYDVGAPVPKGQWRSRGFPDY